jgi:TPR repeat protein
MHDATTSTMAKARIRVTTVALFTVAALVGAAGADPLDDARVADQRGDSATEYRLLRPLAEQGNAEAQDALGSMYVAGRGVPQDYGEAVKWFHRAADRGFADAQDALARMYVQGQGVPKDYVQAHMWFNLAASRFSGADPLKNFDAAARDNLAESMTPSQVVEAQRLAREWHPKMTGQ